MLDTSYEILIYYHRASVIYYQEHIKRLIYRPNKLHFDIDENIKLMREKFDIKKY